MCGRDVPEHAMFPYHINMSFCCLVLLRTRSRSAATSSGPLGRRCVVVVVSFQNDSELVNVHMGAYLNISIQYVTAGMKGA